MGQSSRGRVKITRIFNSETGHEILYSDFGLVLPTRPNKG